MTSATRTLSAAVIALAVGIGAVACGGDDSSSEQASPPAAAAPSQPAAASPPAPADDSSAAPSQPAPASPPAPAPAKQPAPAKAAPKQKQKAQSGIAIYKPSKVVNQSPGSTTLNSPDPVGKVSAFYLAMVDKGGWQTVSKSVSNWTTSLTVKKSGQGATISVARLGSGTTISLVTYPAS